MGFSRLSINLLVVFLLLSLGTVTNIFTLSHALEGEGERNNSTDPGGSRGECDVPESYEYPLTLLVPADQDALTTNLANPTLYVYVPFELSEEDPGVFYMRGPDGRFINRQTFTGISGSGIIEITPDEPLEPEQSYQWFFEVFCNDPNMDLSTGNLFLESSTIRFESSSTSFWYDQLASAAVMKRQGSTEAWQNLLQEAGLEHLLGAEFIE